MKLKELLETFERAIKTKEEYFEVFKNPTPKEITSLASEGKVAFGVRYILDFKNNFIYVWDDDLLHADVARNLKIPYGMNSPYKGYVFGQGFYNKKINKIISSFTILRPKDGAPKKKEVEKAFGKWLSFVGSD